MSHFEPFSPSVIGALGAIANFLKAPITGDLMEVPGIGRVAKQSLLDHDIKNTWMLMGKYLSFKEEDISGPERDSDIIRRNIVDHHERFYSWLREVIPPKGGQQNKIVRAIAEKMSIIHPGLFDSSIYNEEEGEGRVECEVGDKELTV